MKITIEKRKNGSIRLRWRDPENPDKRCSRNLSKISMQKAEQEKERLEHALNTGDHVETGAPTVSNLLEYMERYWAPERSPEYWQNMQHALKLVQQHIGNRLDYITSLAADRFKADIKSGRKASTVNGKLAHIRTAMNQAVKWNMINGNVFNDVPDMPVPDNIVQTWARSDIEKLLKNLDRPLDRCMIYLALDGGLRAKEIANISIFEDYEPDTGIVYVRNRNRMTKSRKERGVCVLPEHTPEMNELLQKCRQTGMEYPFYCGNNQGVSQRFYTLRKRYNIKNTLHDLRHTCATIMARSSSPRDVQEYLGHSDIKTTEKHYFGRQKIERLKTLRMKAENTE